MDRSPKTLRWFALVCLLGAQTFGAGAQVNPRPRGVMLGAIQTAVIESIAAQDKSVEVRIDGSVLVVSRVNSNQNASNHIGRNNEAAAIAAIAAKSIANDGEYSAINVIRVEYIDRAAAGGGEKEIDSMDFRKNAKGEFEVHLT
ncbi:hypothetical protein [uncultured Rhodoblastus sp.]|uniref:hypothetical protein n=1 Tax=uncultured Rhodoblastus sp. TaxID=543037 RepID=UPI0025EFBBE2|nr:hypothetical protein [uncultured Rhodoblastus sp.]